MPNPLAIPYNRFCFGRSDMCFHISPSSTEQQNAEISFGTVCLPKRDKNRETKRPDHRKRSLHSCECISFGWSVLQRFIALYTEKCIVTNTTVFGCCRGRCFGAYTFRGKTFVWKEKQKKKTIFFLIVISHPSILHHYFLYRSNSHFMKWELKSKNNLLTKK